MRCYCGGAGLATAWEAMLRVCRDYVPGPGGRDPAGYQPYVEELAYRWAVTCQLCASTLDNYFGVSNTYSYHKIDHEGKRRRACSRKIDGDDRGGKGGKRD